MHRTDPRPLEDFAMWAMLQPGVQKANIPLLKKLVHDWITLCTQKGDGNRKGQKGIPWEPKSKAVSFDNIERIKMGILCEAVALVLSGVLDSIEANNNDKDAFGGALHGVGRQPDREGGGDP